MTHVRSYTILQLVLAQYKERSFKEANTTAVGYLSRPQLWVPSV